MTTPLLLLDLLLMAALPIGDTLWIVFADIAMILTGLFGALSDTHFKWVRNCHWVMAEHDGPGTGHNLTLSISGAALRIVICCT